MTPQDDIWLGLDVGTQSAKCMAASGTGEVWGRASRRVLSRRDGERHEQDPEHWWQALAGACRTALEDVPRDSIRGVACCATSGTILLVDETNAPLTPGLMYDDTRAAKQADQVNEVGEVRWASLGYLMQPSWALPKLRWLIEEGEGIPRGARLAHQADYVTRRLVGREVPADMSHALKSGYDLIEERWPHAELAELDVPPEVLPEVVRPGTRLGPVGAKAAEETGIPVGTPVVAGMTDGCAAQIGAGGTEALDVGSWNSVLGTTLVLKGVSRSPVRDRASGLYCHRSPDGDWLPGGASSVGAGVLSAGYPGRDLDVLSARAAAREPARVIAYPLLSRGERFPFVAADAEGFVLGVPADETDHYAALLQGVAFVERLCFDCLDLLGAPTGGQLSLSGGAARNRYWCQLRSDVLERPVRVPANTETGLGMAVLAAASVRGERLADVAGEMVRGHDVVEPRPDGAERFREPYLRLVDELERRGWLESALATHSRRRAAA